MELETFFMEFIENVILGPKYIKAPYKSLPSGRKILTTVENFLYEI